MKLYDTVKEMLEKYPPLRDSDRLLIWNIWGKQGKLIRSNDPALTSISKQEFMLAASPESIRRCRQKIQENFPELRASENIQKEKDAIANQKGTHVYREELKGGEKTT